MAGWSEQMVDRLQALKLTGWSFEACWRVALAENPPHGSEFRGLHGRTLSLLTDPREPDAVEFLRRACEDAWHGRRPALAHLATALDHHVLVGLEAGRPMTRAQARGFSRAVGHV